MRYIGLGDYKQAMLDEKERQEFRKDCADIANNSDGFLAILCAKMVEAGDKKQNWRTAND